MTLNGRLRNSSAPETPSSASSELPFKFKKADPIQKAGDEIVAGYQRIEEAWTKAEAKLALAHVPVDVKVKVWSGPLDDGEPQYGEYIAYLGYVKLKNQWRICFIRDTVEYVGLSVHQATECRPITECSVDIRLKMFELFPKLYEEVIKVTKEFVPVIKDKVAEFEKSLETIDLWS